MSELAVQAPPREMTVSDDVMIQMNAVHKWYGDFHVLKDINLTVHKGERIVICGPSGSGKSTMIRCINRLESHDGFEAGVEEPPDPRQRRHPRLDLGRVLVDAHEQLASARLAAYELAYSQCDCGHVSPSSNAVSRGVSAA